MPSSSPTSSSPTSSSTTSSLAGKVALVTGASAGIGLAVARRLVSAGARVALVARTQSTLDAAVTSLGGPAHARAYPANVTDLAAMAALPGRVVADFGQLDILVNNAGCNHRGPLLSITAEQAAEVITTNLTSPIYLTRAAAPHLRRGGAIINVASLAGMVPVHHEAAYSASKAGLRAFTRVITEEMAERDVHVSSVCPGPVDTGFFGDVSTVPDLVFSQPMSSADDIADAVMSALRAGTPEVAIPALSGRLATLAYVFPSVMRALRPLLERRGAANKRRYIASKG